MHDRNTYIYKLKVKLLVMLCVYSQCALVLCCDVVQQLVFVRLLLLLLLLFALFRRVLFHTPHTNIYILPFCVSRALTRSHKPAIPPPQSQHIYKTNFFFFLFHKFYSCKSKYRLNLYFQFLK